MSFISEQDGRLGPLWSQILEHRFLRETRDGTIADDVFAIWLRQDYLFVEAAIPFIAALIPRAPKEHWAALSGVIAALEKELKLFEERAAHLGVDLRGAPPSFTCHAYIQYLLATAHTRSYPEAYTVLYAAERTYHESWRVVQRGIDPDSPWTPFVENWAGEDFAGYVGYLAGELEKLAAAAGPAERARMAELYRLTLLYEIAFWEMASTAEGWPGVEDDLATPGTGPRWNPDVRAAVEGAWSHMDPTTPPDNRE
jgi:formylaminopyrimidine deformylase / aminopyrimidine aminohydrolase